jgi:hypothetical protein
VLLPGPARVRLILRDVCVCVEREGWKKEKKNKRDALAFLLRSVPFPARKKKTLAISAVPPPRTQLLEPLDLSLLPLLFYLMKPTWVFNVDCVWFLFLCPFLFSLSEKREASLASKKKSVAFARAVLANI